MQVCNYRWLLFSEHSIFHTLEKVILVITLLDSHCIFTYIKYICFKCIIQLLLLNLWSCSTITTISFKMFPSPQRHSLGPFTVNPCSYSQTQANILSVFIDLPVLVVLCVGSYNMWFFPLWLLSLSRIFLRSVTPIFSGKFPWHKKLLRE